MIIFSLNSIKQRVDNLELIIPNILAQCDLLYVNLIGYSDIPKILLDDKIKITKFFKGGSELRFFKYNSILENSYFFTIDDDILYPIDYAETLIKYMKLHENKCICCVHGSNVDLSKNKDFYLNNRKVYHFKSENKEIEKVMFPGVGTSCFYKGTFDLELANFKTANMSDPYIGSFAYSQNLSVYSIPRDGNWVKPLDEKNVSIYGNNPYQQIDELINLTFKNEKND